MSIYYYGKLVGVYNLKQKNEEQTKQQSPTLVGDILKERSDYQNYAKPRFTVRHFQDA